MVKDATWSLQLEYRCNSLNVALFCLLLLQNSFENLCPVSMITLDDAPEKHIFSPRRHMIRYLDCVFFSVPCVQQALNYLKLCKLEVSFLGIGIGYSRCLCPWSICDLELDHYIICCGWLWPWRTLLCCVHLSPNPCPTRQQQLCSVSFLQGRNVNGKSITPVINNPFSMREVKHGQQWPFFFRKFS